MSERTGDDISRLRRRLWLGAILAVGLVLRVYRLSWGLPDFVPPDGLNYFIRPAARFAAAAEFVPPSFAHSPLFVYTIGLLDLAWSHTVGEPIDLSQRPLRKGLGGLRPKHGLLGTQELSPQLTTLILLARSFCATVATASIAVLYLLARRLAGVRAALLAAAAFALCPLHVLESHRVNADALMILLALLTTHQAVVADQTACRRRLWAAFALGGLTGAMRYNGLAIITVPTWVAFRWPQTFVGERIRLLLEGLAIAAGVVAIGLLPAAFAWRRFVEVIQAMGSAGFVAGGNIDLSGLGWIYTRYVYQLFVTLPYSMGWLLYLCGLIGLPLLAKANARSFAVVLAAIVPFFLVQGAAVAVEHRYYQLLIPFLALTAGVALDAIMARREGVGGALAAIALGYTLAVAGSQCLRLGLGTQKTVASFIETKAREAAAVGRILDVGYPGAADLLYDPVRTQIQDRSIRPRHIPGSFVQQFAPPSEAHLSENELVRQFDQWVDAKEVDVILLPSWQEDIAKRSHPNGNAARFYTLLADEKLQFELAGDFKTGFFTQQLYTWADPLLRTHRATGILDYKVFVRTAPGPTQ